MSQPPEGVGVALKEAVTLPVAESVPERDTTERVEVVEALDVTVSERAAERDAKLRVAEALLEAERDAAPLRLAAGEALLHAVVDRVRLQREEGEVVLLAESCTLPDTLGEVDSEGEAEDESVSLTVTESDGERDSEALPVGCGEADCEADCEALRERGAVREREGELVAEALPAGLPAARAFAVAVAQAVAVAPRTRSEGEGEGEPVPSRDAVAASEGAGASDMDSVAVPESEGEGALVALPWSEGVPSSETEALPLAEKEASEGEACCEKVSALEHDAEREPTKLRVSSGVAEREAVVESLREGGPEGDGEAEAESRGLLPLGEALTRALAVPFAPLALTVGLPLGDGVGHPVAVGDRENEGLGDAMGEGDKDAEAGALSLGGGDALELAQPVSLPEGGGEAEALPQGEEEGEGDALPEGGGELVGEGAPLREPAASLALALLEAVGAGDAEGHAVPDVPFLPPVGVAARPVRDAAALREAPPLRECVRVGRGEAEPDPQAEGERVAARTVALLLRTELVGLAVTRRGLPVAAAAVPVGDRVVRRCGVAVAFHTVAVPEGAPLKEAGPLSAEEALPLREASGEPLPLREALALPDHEGEREDAPVRVAGGVPENAPVGVGKRAVAVAAPGEAEGVPVTAWGSVVPEAAALAVSLGESRAALPEGGALAESLKVPGRALPEPPPPPALAEAEGGQDAEAAALALLAREAAAEPLGVPLAVAVIVADACTRTG
jgi:hypothetical protein